MFHSRAWMQALKQTYRYEPVGYTQAAPGEEFSLCFGFLPGKELADRATARLDAFLRSL